MTAPHSRSEPGSYFGGVVGALTRLSFGVQRILEGIAEEHRLSLIQGRLLVGLLERRPTMSEVATMLYLERSSTTGLVARAEAHGLVRREREGGLTRVVLTELGQQEAQDMARAVMERIEARTRQLSDSERQQLTALADRLVRAADPARVDESEAAD